MRVLSSIDLFLKRLFVGYERHSSAGEVAAKIQQEPVKFQAAHIMMVVVMMMMMMMMMMMIFIYCSWVSTRWQWSVNLYRNRKETAIYKGKTIHKKYSYTEYTK